MNPEGSLLCLWTNANFFWVARQWLLASGCAGALGTVTDSVPYGVPRAVLGLVELSGPKGYPKYDSTSSPLLKSKFKGL